MTLQHELSVSMIRNENIQEHFSEGEPSFNEDNSGGSFNLKLQKCEGARDSSECISKKIGQIESPEKDEYSKEEDETLSPMKLDMSWVESP